MPASGQPPVHVGLDIGFDRGVDDVLALGFWFGLCVTNKIILSTCTVSRNDFSAAVFCDLMAGTYFPKRNVEHDDLSGENIVGLSSRGVPTRSRVLSAIVDRQSSDKQLMYARSVKTLNDTAEASLLLRNQLHAERCRIVMTGRATNLLELLTLRGSKALIQSQLEYLVISAGRFGAGNPDPLVASNPDEFRKLLSELPCPILFAGAETGEAIRFPASSIERDYAWTQNHPLVDAYRAFGKMPYDAGTHAMAAVLHAAIPDEKYFRVSDPGAVVIRDDGTTVFTPSREGKHRYLMVDSNQIQKVQEIYTQATSINPDSKTEKTKETGSIPANSAAERGIARPLLLFALAVLTISLYFCVPKRLSGQDASGFDRLVKPTLTVCSQCHSGRLVSGGIDVTKLSSPASIITSRETWERVVRRVRSGEMPPPGTPRPPAEQLSGMTDFIEACWRRADSDRAPDPGRISLHRLNRTEYANTVRDLLGLRFRADKDLPADDSGGGFDTIADLLTISPALAERYFAVAEMLARWAISNEVPPDPLRYSYRDKDREFRLVDLTIGEVEHRIDYSGDYTVSIDMSGARPNDSPPVKMGFWMDSALIATAMVETKGYDRDHPYPESQKELHVFLPAGDHIFRAAFIDDKYITAKKPEVVFSEQNKFIVGMGFVGPVRSSSESESRKRILTCDPAGGPGCVRSILSVLARRAYRRSVTDSEIQSLMRFPELARKNGQTPEEGIQMAIQAILVSPVFLYRIERDAARGSSPSGSVRISGFDLASRLSYFLWSSMPDDQLLDLAGSGQLAKPEVLRKQVDRMLADPKSSEFASNFAGQWLETRNLAAFSPDPKKFPDWSPELRDAMKAETALFFEYVLKADRPITDFLDADYTFLNETLATHYGVEGVTGPEFRRVDLRQLPVRSQRGGVLSQAGVLTVSSYPARTSPVLRGKYVLENILGASAPPPPPNVPKLDEQKLGREVSMRQQLEQHRKNPECAACHNRMDPLGFGLENYDAIGHWRTQDGKFPLDARGKLPDGTTFDSPAEMRRVLIKQLPQFSRNLIDKLLTYALGRGVEAYDRPTVDKMLHGLEANGYRFRPLIYSIVESLPFQYRRAEPAVANKQ